MDSPLFAPIVALVAWTFVMMIWMYATRFPAMARKGISLKGRVGSKGGDRLDRRDFGRGRELHRRGDPGPFLYLLVAARQFRMEQRLWAAFRPGRGRPDQLPPDAQAKRQTSGAAHPRQPLGQACHLASFPNIWRIIPSAFRPLKPAIRLTI